jgi:hypothetical protein
MAVSEALALQTSLADRFGIELDAVIANRVLPSRFTSADALALSRAAEDPAVRSARWFAARAKAQRAQLARLRRGVAPARLTTLPFRFETELDRADVERFADLLGSART